MKKAAIGSTSKPSQNPGSVPLAHTSWLRPFVDYFAERKIDLRGYMVALRVQPDVILSGDGWITKHQLYGFLDAVAVGEEIPELGFVVGERLTYETLGVIGEAMASCETLGGAIGEFCRLIPRHVEGNEVWIEGGRGGGIWLLNRTSVPPGSEIADHAGLMSMINIVRLALGSDWYPERVRLQVASTDAYRRVPNLADREFEFDSAATGCFFPAEALTREITVDDPMSLRHAEPDRALLLEGESDSEKLQRLLRGIVGVGGLVPTIGMMAELVGVSPRTLHRRLKEGGVTYQQLLDDARYRRALERLEHSDASVKELAFELGYSGANNFIRAFRRISGMTPGQFRERQAV